MTSCSRINGLCLANEWINQCLEYLEVQGPLYSLSDEDIVQKVFSLFIECGDLREISVGDATIPSMTELAKIHNRPLLPVAMDRLILQIDEIVNVGSPQDSRRSKTSKRLLKLFLTDGRNNIIGIELLPIPGLEVDTLPGSKLVVYSKAQIKRGAVLLSPTNCKFLGGESLRLSNLVGSAKVDMEATTIPSSILREVQNKQSSASAPNSAVYDQIIPNMTHAKQDDQYLLSNLSSTVQKISPQYASSTGKTSSIVIPVGRTSSAPKQDSKSTSNPAPIIENHSISLTTEISTNVSMHNCSSDEEYSSSTIRRDSSGTNCDNYMLECSPPFHGNSNDRIINLNEASFSPQILSKRDLSTNAFSGNISKHNSVVDSPFRQPSKTVRVYSSIEDNLGPQQEPIDLTTPDDLRNEVEFSSKSSLQEIPRSVYHLTSIREIVSLLKSEPLVMSSDPKNLFPSSGCVRGTVIGVTSFSVVDSGFAESKINNSTTLMKEYNVVVHFNDGECTIVADVDSGLIEKLLNLPPAIYQRNQSEKKAKGKSEYKSYTRSVMGKLCHLQGIFHIEIKSTNPPSSNLPNMSNIEDTVREYRARLLKIQDVDAVNLCHDMINLHS